MRVEPRKTAIVVGGSIAGLTAALLLEQDGWTVDVFERVDTELSGRGAGIVTHADLFGVLEAARINITPDFGVAVRTRRVFGREGTCVAQLDYPQILTSWDRLYQELRSRFASSRYHKGRKVERVTETAEGVVAHFADGSSVAGDILVAADGFRSAIRAQYFPGTQPNYAGYIAWRGLVSERQLSARTRRDIFEHFAFSLPEGEQMLGYPVAGAGNESQGAKRRYNWVWYRPASASQLRELLRDDSGAVHDVSIPPPLIRREAIVAMRAASARILAPQFEELVERTPHPFFQPIYDLEVPRMAVGRVAIIGDAAFVVRPHVGAGVTKAAQDALALVVALRNNGDDFAAGLLAFEHDRLKAGARIMSRARHLGAYMQSQLHTPEERRNAERFRAPDAVMLETASLEFLHASSA